ncbi:hypothetical protein C8Q80DRAFT_1275776 [Daedaleopsis nitida]|nr:hypothetical protein C8Q80DRAFT_1275776 [Daedaleopsis nitida]
MATYPRAPELPIEMQTHVFVHHSAPGSETNHRLEKLGATMLDAAYIAALANANPAWSGDQLRIQAEGTLPAFADIWVGNYGWRRPGVMSSPPGVNLNDPQETLWIFRTYAGAVCETHGHDVLFQWIAALV